MSECNILWGFCKDAPQEREAFFNDVVYLS